MNVDVHMAGGEGCSKKRRGQQVVCKGVVEKSVKFYYTRRSKLFTGVVSTFYITHVAMYMSCRYRY